MGDKFFDFYAYLAYLRSRLVGNEIDGVPVKSQTAEAYADTMDKLEARLDRTRRAMEKLAEIRYGGGEG